MLAIEIDNKKIEDSLYSQFETVENIKKYFYDLIIEDMKSKEMVKLIKEGHKKEFVSKDEVFATLDSIR